MANHRITALIHRHSSGDRDPALLNELNAVSWECFHDPWEKRPGFQQPEKAEFFSGFAPVIASMHGAHEEPYPIQDQARQASDYSLDAIEAVWPPRLGSIIVANLELRQFPYHLDNSGAFHSDMELPEGNTPDLHLCLSYLTRKVNFLNFQMACSKEVRGSTNRAAELLVDKWNKGGQFLQAILVRPSQCQGKGAGLAGTLLLHHSLPLPQRIHRKTIDNYLNSALWNSNYFWEIAQAELGL